MFARMGDQSAEEYDLLATEDNAYYGPFGDYLHGLGVRFRFSLTEAIPVRRRFWRCAEAWSPRGLVIRHRGTGQYVMLDNQDEDEIDCPVVTRMLGDPLCLLYLRSQYRPDAYRSFPYTKVRPWTYWEYEPRTSQLLIDRQRLVPRTEPKLFFRGLTGYTNRGEILGELRSYGIMNDDLEESGVDYTEYLDQCSHRKLALSLPGHGNLCHREFEAMAMGTPVLMPRHKNVLHEPLIPDHHYVSIDADTEEDEPREVARRLKQRYDEVIGDHDYLKQVAQNAIEWYDRNVRFPASFVLTCRLLGGPQPNTTQVPFQRSHSLPQWRNLIQSFVYTKPSSDAWSRLPPPSSQHAEEE